MSADADRLIAENARLLAEVESLRSWWCPTRKHRRTTSERLRNADCRECAAEARREACPHSDEPVFSHHAGILGNRYACRECGAAMPTPEASA